MFAVSTPIAGQRIAASHPQRDCPSRSTGLPRSRSRAMGLIQPSLPEPAPAAAPVAALPRAALRNDTESEAARLMRAVNGGCRVSFARLYELTSARLFAIVRRIHKDTADAEDVLQETYIKIWDRCGQFDATRGEAVHWMAGIAHFHAIDHLRRASVRPHSRSAWAAVADEPYAGLACSQPQPLDHAMRAEETRAVQEQLRMLTTEQRESLTLAFYDGLTQQEISARLGRPLGTVKSWMRRAFSSLRQPLQAHQNSPGPPPTV